MPYNRFVLSAAIASLADGDFPHTPTPSVSYEAMEQALREYDPDAFATVLIERCSSGMGYICQALHGARVDVTELMAFIKERTLPADFIATCLAFLDCVCTYYRDGMTPALTFMRGLSAMNFRGAHVSSVNWRPIKRRLRKALDH